MEIRRVRVRVLRRREAGVLGRIVAAMGELE